MGRSVIESTEIQKLADLEDAHWWYWERRNLLARALRRVAASGVRPGRALDIGAAGGGNTRVLQAHGWQPIALEYSSTGAEVARSRGLNVVRADARCAPLANGSVGLVVAFDVLEHIEEDYLATGEIHRVLEPGGAVLIAVPADMRLWSTHDDAVGHVRRYDRTSLVAVIEKAGLVVDDVRSWNVLLRPVVRLYRRRDGGSDLRAVPTVINMGLRTVVVAERFLPVGSWPGVSLLLRAHRPR